MRVIGVALALVAIVAVGAAGACGGRAEDRRTPAYDDVQRIFDQSCAGAACHRSPTAEPPRSVDLAPGVSRGHLVGQPSAVAPGRTLVVAGAPDDSYLLCTIDPACAERGGARMPPTFDLSPETVEAVRRWIADGALPDATLPPPPDADDDVAPVFAGLTSATATGEHTIELQWAVAIDRTPPSRLRYEVYVAEVSGQQTFATATVEVTAATGATLTVRDAGHRYFIVVRARDERGHEDDNRIERSTQTPDVTAPEFAGAAAVTETVPATLDVTWAAAADNATDPAAIGYRVYLSTAAGAEDFAVPTRTVVGVTHATLPGLAPSTTYHVVVRAFDQAGNEEHNQIERSVTTLDTVAPTFAGVATATGAPNAVVLTWAAATDDSTAAADLVYLVYRATTAGGQDLTTPTYVTPPGATVFSAGGLAPNRTYHFIVRARDGAGNVDGNLIQRSATTPIIVDNQPPIFAGATSATALGAGAIRLVWSPATDNVTLTGNVVYRIYRATAAGGESFAAPTYTTLPGAASFVATGLSPTTRYFFVVRAVDQAGNPDGNLIEVDATTPADTTPPTFAGVSAASPVNSSSIALSWAAATDDISPAAAVRYDVYRALVPGGETFAAPTYVTNPGATGFIATGLAPLTTYFFVVRARDQAGNADGNTAERSAATTADVTPPLFAGAVSAAPTGSPGELDLTWAPASDQASTADHLRYLIFPALNSGLQTFAAPAATTAPGATSFRLTGLLPGTNYFVVIRARDEAGNVDDNTVQVHAVTTPDTIAPTFGGLLTAIATNPGHVRLTWADGNDDFTPRDQLVYQIYAAASPGGENFAAPLLTSPPGATTVSVGGLTAATTLFFVVRVRDQAGHLDGNTVERSATTPPITVHFAAQVAPIFAAACALGGCHAPPGPAVGLDLSNAAVTHQQTVNVSSVQFAQVLRVAPGDSDGSYVVSKIRGGGAAFEGDPMPPAGSLSAADIATIVRWVDEGAPDN